MAFGEDMMDGYAEGEEPVVFHHKKGEFRRLEDDMTRELAEGGGFKSKGFFGVLVGTKGNRMIFMALSVCVVLILTLSLLAGRKNEGVLSGVRFKMDAFSIEENVYVSVALNMTQAGLKGGDAARPRHFFAEVNALDSDGASVASSKAEYLFVPESNDGKGKKDGGKFMRVTFTDYEAESVECRIFLADSDEGFEDSEGEGLSESQHEGDKSILLKCRVSKH